MPSQFAPIVLFVYNRPIHTQKTLDSLVNCQLAEKSDLFIFSDAPKKKQGQEKVEEVRTLIRKTTGFKSVNVVERPVNFGLAKSVIEGVTEIVNRFGEIIVLEDDMVFTTDFLVFLNNALQYYKNKPTVFSISGYAYPIELPSDFTEDVYLLPRASSWGWATWADRWSKADWNMPDYKKLMNDRKMRQAFEEGGEDLTYQLIKQQRGLADLWAVRWCYTHFKNDAYCLFPRQSKLQNIGNDFTGQNSPLTKRFEVSLSEEAFELSPTPQLNSKIIHNLQRFFRPSWYRKIVNYFKLRP